MKADTYPLQVLLVTVAGWVNRHQQEVIDYLVEENRVLKEQMKGRRLRLTDEQRRRLAAKGKRLGRKTLNRIVTIVTPDTIMRWYHRLIALKWTCEAKRVGRPGLMKRIAALIVRMALENSGWGYCRIQGELKQLGHRVAPSTIAKVAKREWDQTRAGPSVFLEDFSAGPLGRDRRNGLLHERSVDTAWLDDLLRPLCDRSEEPEGPLRGSDDEPQRILHGPGRSQPD